MFLERKAHEAFFVHLDNMKSCNGDPLRYLEPLQKQIISVLSEFVERNGILIHGRLKIFDKKDLPVPIDELNSDILLKISRFISVQQMNLKIFLSKIDCTETHLKESQLKWKGKKTDFIELFNILFEGEFIGNKEGSLSKKEFMELISSLFNIKIQSWEVALSKAVLRENPSQFLDKLKSTLSDYCDKSINITNR